MIDQVVYESHILFFIKIQELAGFGIISGTVITLGGVFRKKNIIKSNMLIY